MRYTTWGECRDKIEDENDIQEDPDFLAEGELAGIINDAIDKCEQHFIKIPGYFEATTTISVTSGDSDYDLPDDIYGNKIRNITHSTEYYEVKKLKDIKDTVFQSLADGADLRYRVINNAGDKPFLRLYPTPDTDCTLTLDYIRNATRIDPDGSDDQEIDIPEAMGFIYAYANWRLRKKEKILAEIADAKAEMDAEKQDMIDALAVMVDDDNNEIEPDTSLLEDHT
jgi:hypothetical protein